jgi:putative oxidoreductase
MKDLALLILRTVMGMTLLAHGYTKLFGGGPSNFAKMLESKNVPAPELAAYASGLAEFGGGLALLTGTMTRLAALGVLINMVVAIRTVHWEQGFFGQGGWEFPAQLASGAVALLVAGPGAISVDGLFSGVGKAKRAAAGAGQAVAARGQAVSRALPSTDDLRKRAEAAKKLAA